MTTKIEKSPSYAELAAVVDSLREGLALTVDMLQEIRHASISVLANSQHPAAVALQTRGIAPELVSENSTSQGVSSEAIRFWQSYHHKQERILQKLTSLITKLAGESKAA